MKTKVGILIATDKRGYPHNIFLISPRKHMLWYSLEAPCWGASNGYPQHMFSWRNKKDISLFRMKKKKKTYLLLCILSVVYEPRQAKTCLRTCAKCAYQPVLAIFHYLLVFVFKPKNSDYRSLLCYLLIIILPCICLTQFRLNRLPSPILYIWKADFQSYVCQAIWFRYS